MKVLKFGGTSVGTIDSLTNVRNIVDGLQEPAIVVVSALGGLTDRLIATAREAAEGKESFRENVRGFAKRHHDIIDALVPEERKEEVRNIIDQYLEQLEEIYHGIFLIHDLPEKTLDTVVSFGERMSSVIVTAILRNARHYDSPEFIKTEKWFNKNIADRKLTEDLIKKTFILPLDNHAVLGGFISRDRDNGEITNLGRGGSDYTAALIAAALDCDLLEIWTDVDGFMTADPRIIPDARVLKEMSFIESMELCSFGAKVIYPPTIYPVFHKNIPIKILNTFRPEVPGTLITDHVNKEDPHVRGISSVKDISMICVEGELAGNIPEINSRTYNAMARHGISIFLVAQPDKEKAFAFALPQTDVDKAEKALNEEFAPELSGGTVKTIRALRNLAIVAIVGDGIKEIKGLDARVASTLRLNNIVVHAMSNGASDTTVAVVVDLDKVNDSLRYIHDVCIS